MVVGALGAFSAPAMGPGVPGPGGQVGAGEIDILRPVPRFPYLSTQAIQNASTSMITMMRRFMMSDISTRLGGYQFPLLDRQTVEFAY